MITKWLKKIFKVTLRIALFICAAGTFHLTALSSGVVAAQAWAEVRKPRHEITYQIQLFESKDRATAEEEECKESIVPRLSLVVERIKYLVRRKLHFPVPPKDVQGTFYGYQSQYGF